MKTEYQFYYDESGHSRKLTEKSITADNYDDFFVSVIVGINNKQTESLNKDYFLFEEKYKDYYGIDELKSTIFSDKKYKYGFKSFKQIDLEAINDFFNLIIKYNLLIYISVQNKIEYLIDQLLRAYKNNYLVDADAIRYTVTKAITVYRPKKVLSSIYQGDSFATELKSFLSERIATNGDLKLKEWENFAFEQTCFLIDKNKELSFVEWDYTHPFVGFSLFLKEHNIKTKEIIIDKEGSGNTLKAAKECGFKESCEKDSKDEVGIRIADMLAGLINGFIKSILVSTSYICEKEPIKKLIDKKWFELNDLQCNCYAKMQTIIIEQNESWYKTYCSSYSDPFLFLICLLNYVSQSGMDYLTKNTNMNNEYLNTYVCSCLQKRFEFMRSKLKVEPADIKDDYFINKRGAREYLSSEKRATLLLKEGETKRLFVLSAGIFHLTNTPTITVQTDDGPVAYDLPQELYDWTFSLVGFANMGTNLLPEYVVFTRKNDKYYADIE